MVEVSRHFKIVHIKELNDLYRLSGMYLCVSGICSVVCEAAMGLTVSFYGRNKMCIVYRIFEGSPVGK